jgi:septal ring factor EnvC (AmiA/AmiB activator)
MLPRWFRSTTTLDQTKEQLARQELQLRDRVEKLEKMIADAPRLAEQVERRQREELLMRANEGGSRLDVSLALRDKRYGDDPGTTRPRGSLRKERRDGRIIFLVLIVALTATVLWLASHLHF